MTETQLKGKVQKYLMSLGAYCFKTSDNYRHGVPDLFVAYKGRAIWIELKIDKGVVAPLQQWHIDCIKKQDCEAYIARSLEDVKEIIVNGSSRRCFQIRTQ